MKGSRRAFWKTQWYFLKTHYGLPLWTITISLIWLTVGLLSRVPAEPLLYSLLLTAVLFLFVFITMDIRFCARHRLLRNGAEALRNMEKWLPEPRGQLEADYQALLTRAVELLRKGEQDDLLRQQEQSDYYTLWVHQIKTPIAAMGLLLQSFPEKERVKLSEELFKIEQYAEMALQFTRLESLSSDLELRRYDLHSLAKKAVKKYSSIFIHKRIALTMEDFSLPIITDEKWMLLILEQLLSNALKYTTPGGRVTIAPGTEGNSLVISDNGIGIREEDIPRVFQRGFTGFNGRMDQRATGIGLYLANETAKKLHLHLSITSTLGQGTSVTVTANQEAFRDYGGM